MSNCTHAEVEPGAESYDDCMGTAQDDESRSMEEEGDDEGAVVGVNRAKKPKPTSHTTEGLDLSRVT